MSRIVITGGAGYLAGALTDCLIKQHINDFLVFDNLLYEDRYLKPVPFEFGDVTNYGHLSKHLEDCEVLVWLAAIVGDGACACNPARTVQVNEDALKTVAQNFRGKIFFMSTCSVYGAQDGVLTETSPTNPLSLYAGTKLNCEKALEGKDAICLRLGTLYGVGDSYSRVRADLVVNTMTLRAVTKGALSVYGGEQYRPILHVKDVAEFIAENLYTKATGIYNISGENTSILGLAERVSQVTGCRIDVTPMKFEDARNYRVSREKLEKGFPWRPKHTVEEAVKELAFLSESRRIKDPENEVYSNERFLRSRA